MPSLPAARSPALRIIVISSEDVMTPEQATTALHGLLRLMLSKKASDLFLSVDFPPAIKLDGSDAERPGPGFRAGR